MRRYNRRTTLKARRDRLIGDSMFWLATALRLRRVGDLIGWRESVEVARHKRLAGQHPRLPG